MLNARQLTLHILSRTGAFASRVWFPVLQLSAIAVLTWLILRVAGWERSPGGVVAVLLLLTLPSAALIFGSRRTLSIAFTIGGGLLLVEAANAEKMNLLNEHLHIIDLLSLLEYTIDGNFILIKLYWELAIAAAFVVCAFILFIYLLRFIEDRGFRYCGSLFGSRRIFIIVGIVAVTNAAIFFSGNYFWVTCNEFVYSRIKADGPVRFSDLLASLVDLVHVEQELSGSGIGAKAESAQGQACSNCPDIITIHVESVFDPTIQQDYANVPSLTKFLSSRLISSNGPLMTAVLGGWSMISEFSFNCGLDHRLFGVSGLFPNFFLSNAINRCIPGYLRDSGYRTEIVSSAPYMTYRIGDTYTAYGVANYSGPETFPIPLTWPEMRDGFFVDAAIDRLRRPRTEPRLLVLLTAFNHGPHGRRQENYSGPYDLDRATTNELRDYMDRLNDSITAFHRLEEFIAASNVPTVIIYYGDHQPDFKLDFSAEALNRFGKEAINHITFYRMARNFPLAALPVDGKLLGIDQLYGEGLTFAGVRQSPELLLKDRISQNCLGGTSTCGEAERRAMRATILK
jgi:hypothetical protein